MLGYIRQWPSSKVSTVPMINNRTYSSIYKSKLNISPPSSINYAEDTSCKVSWRFNEQNTSRGMPATETENRSSLVVILSWKYHLIHASTHSTAGSRTSVKWWTIFEASCKYKVINVTKLLVNSYNCESTCAKTSYYGITCTDIKTN